MKYLLTTLLLTVLMHAIKAQLTGNINYEKLGISFNIPQGWMGQEGDGMLLLGSNEVPGLVIITTHNYTKEQIIGEAKKGISDNNGTSMHLNGQLNSLQSNAVGGEFKGTMEYEPAKAYIIGIPNPYANGPGVSIMATTLKEMYSSQHEDICNQILESIKFSKIERGSELAEWKQWLSNVRLTYMDSYYSSDYTDGGVSGGYSTERRIDLCSKGYFNYGNNSDMSVSGSGVSGYSYGNDSGQGTWEIKIGASGEPTLILNFHNGEEYTYRLEYTEEKLYLNGDRYFRTTDGDYAPECD